jgi:hypothetical protein
LKKLGEGDETSAEEGNDCDGGIFTDSSKINFENNNLDVSKNRVISNLDPSTSKNTISQSRA